MSSKALRNAIISGNSEEKFFKIVEFGGLSKDDIKLKKIFNELENVSNKTEIQKQLDDFKRYFQSKENNFKKSLNNSLLYHSLDNEYLNTKIFNYIIDNGKINFKKINSSDSTLIEEILNYLESDDIVNDFYDENIQNRNFNLKNEINDLIIKLIEKGVPITLQTIQRLFIHKSYTIKDRHNQCGYLDKVIKYIVNNENIVNNLLENEKLYRYSDFIEEPESESINLLNAHLISSPSNDAKKLFIKLYDIFHLKCTNLNFTNEYGNNQTLLMACCYHKSNEKIGLAILERNTENIDYCNNNDETALSLAKKKSMTKLVKKIEEIYIQKGLKFEDDEQLIPVEQQVECCICYELVTSNKRSISKKCSNNHMVHTECIKKWRNISSSNLSRCCPTCRVSM